MNSFALTDHFSLFGLPQAHALDQARLDQAYRRLQAEVHPDRFAAASDAEKRLSIQWATRVNEAYRALKDPLARARYLLSLRGVDTHEETNTSMPAEFLMQQMEWREQVAEARAERDVPALEALFGELAGQRRALFEALAHNLDLRFDGASAALLVRKLRFIEKLAEEIGDALDALEN
jgi:molecular chaperone HscB